MKPLFVTFKVFIGIGAAITMYLASFFWIGSIGEWYSQVQNNFWEFFFSRLLFTVVTGLIFFLLGLLLNRLFRKSVPHKKKYVLFEFISIVVIAVLLVLKTIYWNS